MPSIIQAQKLTPIATNVRICIMVADDKGEIMIDASIQPILEKALLNERLNYDDGLTLFKSYDLITTNKISD